MIKNICVSVFMFGYEIFSNNFCIDKYNSYFLGNLFWFLVETWWKPGGNLVKKISLKFRVRLFSGKD